MHTTAATLQSIIIEARHQLMKLDDQEAAFKPGPTKWSKKELLQLHGFGPSSIPRLEDVLKKQGLSLK